MDNLRFNDFLVVGRISLFIGWCALAIPVSGLYAAEPAGAKPPAERTKQADETLPAATVEIQKIQRLLKLLSSRYPDRYGSVDPGRLDGVLGEETKIAIRKFRSIAHVPEGPVNNSQLTADILSELASMSANAGTDSQGRGEVDCLQTPDAPSCTQAEAVRQTAAKPPAEAPKKVVSTPAAAVVTEAPKPKAPQPVSEQVQATRPAPPVRSAAAKPAPAAPAAVTPKPAPAPAASPIASKIYYVQAASLRSLAAAKREWSRIKAANSAALQGAPVYFERADVKGRGVHYRILIGPEQDRANAHTLCTTLKQNKQSCVVTLRTASEIQKSAEQQRDDSQDGAVKADSEVMGGSPPSAASMPKSGPAEAVKPAVATPVPAPPSNRAAHDEGATPPSASSAAGGVALPGASPQARAAETPAPHPVAEPPQSTAAANANTGPKAVESAMPAVASAAPAKPLVPEKPAAAAMSPVPARPVKPDQGNQALPPAPPAVAEDRSASSAAAPELRLAQAARDDTPSYSSVGDSIVGTGRRLAEGMPDLRLVAAAAALLMFSALLYRTCHRARRANVSTALVPNRFPISGAEEEPADHRQTIAKLEGDFASPQLRDSRRIRDEFLHDILDDNLDDPAGTENRDSAIRVNGSLKALLATNPTHYKSIFLNLMFLAKLGAALNRKEISVDQLNDELSRELRLLRSYFKIHLLELDERHRIRQELPGLFYCLQLSSLPKRAHGAHFSAA